MIHLAEYKFWITQIIAYIFFTFFSFFCLKAITTYSHSASNKYSSYKINSSLYIVIVLLFLYVLVVFSGFRFVRESNQEPFLQTGMYNIGGNDTVQYRYYFEIAKGKSFSEAYKLINKEYLFTVITWVLSNLGFTFDLYLCFFNLIFGLALIEYAKFFDLRKNSFLSILALIALYLGSFNTLRWSLNLLLTIYFVEYFLAEKYKKCFLVMVLCFGIQFTAVIYVLPLFGIMIMRRNRKLGYLFVIFASFICWLPAILDILPLLLLIGRDNQMIVTGQTPTTWLLIYTIYLTNIFIVKKTFLSSKNNKNIFYLILFLIPPTFIELTFGLAYRFSYYGHPILYIHLVYLKDENKKYGCKGLFFTAVESLLLFTVVLKFYFGYGIESTGVPYIFNKYFLFE